MTVIFSSKISKFPSMEKGKKQYVDSDFLKLVGSNVKKYRKKQGLTQKNLAWDCNTDESAIRRIENGQINTTISSLKRIADILEIPIISFFVEN